VDTIWYANSGATDHIISELNKLAVRDKYNDAEKVYTTSGAGMEIRHIGKSFIHTPSRKLELCNIIQVTKAIKNLMSTHCFTLVNNVFFKIHHWFFLIKDRHMRSTLLSGKCHGGLYPIPAPHPVKLAFGINKSSLTRWHERAMPFFK
jgi:hypothetical protein